MNSIIPTPRSRDFTLEAWEADLDRPTSLPPAIASHREIVEEILRRPELMDFMEEFAEVVSKTNAKARKLLENWEQIEELKKESPRWWHLNK